MSELIWNEKIKLNRPLFIIALKGLFDAAEAATNSVDRLVTAFDAKPLAHIDPEIFFNLRLPSMETVALNFSFLSVRTAPGGIIPCSTSSPK